MAAPACAIYQPSKSRAKLPNTDKSKLSHIFNSTKQIGQQINPLRSNTKNLSKHQFKSRYTMLSSFFFRKLTSIFPKRKTIAKKKKKRTSTSDAQFYPDRYQKLIVVYLPSRHSSPLRPKIITERHIRIQAI